MIDAHVHVGPYNRMGCGNFFYYSPRRVVGVLDRCGVDAFIISSTLAQCAGVTWEMIEREAEEVFRLAGTRAHQFLWVSWDLYQSDSFLAILDSGLYEGVKLHESEGHWVELHRKELMEILKLCDERSLHVQFHCGKDKYCSPSTLMAFANMFPNTHFDFAHCRPMDEMAQVLAQCINVWTDTAYMNEEGFFRLNNYAWKDRLMYGSDLPVWQAHAKVSLTRRYREMKSAFRRTGLNKMADMAFNRFLGLI